MVVSALRNNFKVYEIPIDYYPRVGESKLIPFADAWRHIRFMLLYCPVWLYFIPGASGFVMLLNLLLFFFYIPFFFFFRGVLGFFWGKSSPLFFPKCPFFFPGFLREKKGPLKKKKGNPYAYNK